MKKFLIGLSIFGILGFSGSVVSEKMSYETSVELSSKNMIYMNDGFSGASAQEVISTAYELNALRGDQNYAIYLVLNSPGGSVAAMEDIYEALSTIENLHTIQIFSASASAMISQLLPGTRYSLSTSKIMFHPMKLGLPGGEVSQIQSLLDFVKDIEFELSSRVAERLKLSIDEYVEKVRYEYWVYGNKALEDKVVDAIISITCTKELINTKEIKDVVVPFLGKIGEKEVSKCPLLN